MLPLMRLCLDLGGVDTGVQEVCCFVRAWARGGRLLVDSGMAGFTVWVFRGSVAFSLAQRCGQLRVALEQGVCLDPLAPCHSLSV